MIRINLRGTKNNINLVTGMHIYTTSLDKKTLQIKIKQRAVNERAAGQNSHGVYGSPSLTVLRFLAVWRKIQETHVGV